MLYSRFIMLHFAALIFAFWLLWLAPACAETLTDRLAVYPNWHHKPTTQAARGDLAYPDWMAGTWELQTTLIDLVAPLAPGITTPGFERNRDYLNQPIVFPVRFIRGQINPSSGPIPQPASFGVVSDRAFNGLAIAKAYLGADRVQSVKVDPTNPNRQVTILKGNRQLESTITDRAIETPDSQHFLTSELFQQVFRGTEQPYLNQVETTTSYTHQTDSTQNMPQTPMASGRSATIVADQITAIYLSPKDPDYFRAGETPVALYRYKLEFLPPQM
jgi:hypothetical protein